MPPQHLAAVALVVCIPYLILCWCLWHVGVTWACTPVGPRTGQDQVDGDAGAAAVAAAATALAAGGRGGAAADHHPEPSALGLAKVGGRSAAATDASASVRGLRRGLRADTRLYVCVGGGGGGGGTRPLTPLHCGTLAFARPHSSHLCVQVGCRGVVVMRLSSRAAAEVEPVRLLERLLEDLEAARAAQATAKQQKQQGKQHGKQGKGKGRGEEEGKEQKQVEPALEPGAAAASPPLQLPK